LQMKTFSSLIEKRENVYDMIIKIFSCIENLAKEFNVSIYFIVKTLDIHLYSGIQYTYTYFKKTHEIRVIDSSGIRIYNKLKYICEDYNDLYTEANDMVNHMRVSCTGARSGEII